MSDVITGSSDYSSDFEVPLEPAQGIDEGGGARLRESSRFGLTPYQIISRYGLLVVWGLLIIIYGSIEPHQFLTVGTFKTIFGSQEPLVFLMLALVISFAVGEFDLSVAGTLGLSATLLPALVVFHGVNDVEATFIALGAALVVGLVNATFIVILGVNGIITTLAMGTILLGLSLYFADSTVVNGLPTSFGRISNQTLGPLPLSFYYGLILALVMAYVLGATPLGRHIRFVGENREVARLSGVNVKRIRFGTYVVSAFLCGLGGVLLAASVGGNDPSAASSYLLPAFAATFLGTVLGRSGRYTPLGSLIAIYFLVTGIVGLELLGYTGWVSSVFYGVSLLLAVSLSHYVRSREKA
jgi:ribose transport system permease protein